MASAEGHLDQKKQHWDNEVDPGEEAEVMRWKEQTPKAAETDINGRNLLQYDMSRGLITFTTTTQMTHQFSLEKAEWHQ